jgi:D-3-phosphoglycerate dehydrogenase
VKPRLVIIGQAIQSLKVLQECKELFEVSVLADIQEFAELYDSNHAPYSLWIHFDSRLNQEVFLKHSDPAFILTTTTGLTHISAEILERLEGRILHLATERDFLQSITSTAEHTWSLLMAMTSPWLLDTNKVAVKGRSELIREFQLSSRKIGIIGYGRLGKIMTNYALAFGMQVHVFEIDSSIVIPELKGVIRHDKIEDLLHSCDIISLHASAKLPRNEILSQEMLDQCKSGVMIINSSRGSLVDEKHVAKLIDSGAIRFYATDVLREEEEGAEFTPEVLKVRAQSRDRVIITPHIGGANIEAMNLCERNLLSRLISAVKED